MYRSVRSCLTTGAVRWLCSGGRLCTTGRAHHHRSPVVLRLVTVGLVFSVVCLVRFNVLLSRDDVLLDEQQKVVVAPLQSCLSEIVPPKRPSPHELRMRGLWQVYSTEVDSVVELVAYSTFYDDRPILGNESYTRTLAISSFSATKTIYCQIWYEQLPLPVVVEAEQLRVGREYVINNATYRQLLISCKLPVAAADTSGTAIPSHLSFATAPCSQSSILLPVIRPSRDRGDVRRTTNDSLELGVCVAISFGTVMVDELVEWFELNRMLGIGEFNVYNASMTSRLDAVFDYYSRREGVLNVRQMAPPVVDKLKGITLDTIKVSSPASLNDCMLRNMYRYRFIVLIDFDEVIIPRRHDNYAAMMDAILDQAPEVKTSTGKAVITRNDQHHTFAFRNAYFFRYFSTTMDHWMRTMTDIRRTKFQSDAATTSPESAFGFRLVTSHYVYRAPISPLGHAPKSFVDPLRCLSLFNHYCYIRFRQDLVSSSGGKPIGSEGVTGSSGRFVDVPTDLGVSHHYRERCNAVPEQCSKYAAERQLDRSTARFENQLRQRVDHVLKMVRF